MHSLSKTHLTPDVLQVIARQQLGADLKAFDEMKDGYFNTAYRLHLADGRLCVVKIAPPPTARILTYEQGILHAEVEAMRLVRQDTQVPVPAILAYDPSGQWVPSPYFVMEFVAGQPFDKVRKRWPAAAQTDVDTLVGSYVRQIGSIQGPAFGCCAQPANLRPTWPEAFTLVLQNLLADGQALQVELPVAYDSLWEQLSKHFEVLAEVERPQLVHWDLWDGNVFVDEDQRSVTGLIDFERAWWGDPLMEACFRRVSGETAFMHGYGENLLATDNQKRRRILYNLYLYLIIIIEHYYRQYNSDDLLHWGTEQFNLELEWLNSGSLPA